jgi:hypothetical protein
VVPSAKAPFAEGAGAPERRRQECVDAVDVVVTMCLAPAHGRPHDELDRRVSWKIKDTVGP